MELSDLRIFTAVVREGGVTRAAERLNRVQSNVTTRIRQLENRLETKLFDRRGKRLVLTAAGQTLLEYANRILALASEAEIAIQTDTPRGLFRLGAMESTAAVRLPEPLSRLTQRYPDVTLEMKTGNPIVLAEALLAGEIDAAFVSEPIAAAKFDSVDAFVEEVVIVTAREHPPIGEADAVPSTMLVFEHGCPHRRRLEEWYAVRDETPTRTVELGSYHAMLGCVLAGMGAALLPSSVLTSFPESKRLQITRLPAGRSRIKTLMIWPKGARSPVIDALAGLLGSCSAGVAGHESA